MSLILTHVFILLLIDFLTDQQIIHDSHSRNDKIDHIWMT